MLPRARLQPREQSEGKPERQHLYFFFGGTELVRLPDPANRWDGAWIDESSTRQATRFNMRRIGDIAESVVKNARERHARGDVAVLRDGGVAEMEMRYFISHNYYSLLLPPA
ncbi:MAG: hypothetical protein WBF71_04560 [Microthrixaceae bacterium]